LKNGPDRTSFINKQNEREDTYMNSKIEFMDAQLNAQGQPETDFVCDWVLANAFVRNWFSLH